MTATKTNPKYNKHLTPEDQEEIQSCLDHGMTFKAIAARIGKDPTTVSKEVKKHFMYHQQLGYIKAIFSKSEGQI